MTRPELSAERDPPCGWAASLGASPKSTPPANGSIHVSMAIDRGFEVPLAVSLLSLAEVHTNLGIRCEVSVLCAGLDDEVYRKIERDVDGRLAIDWVEVDLARLEGASFTAGLSRATLFRILLPDLLPRTRQRTIYLDADTLVLEPLLDLWETRLEDDCLLAAVRDAGAPYAAGPSGTDWRALRLEPDTAYFNAGLLLLPLERWRQEGTAETTLALLRQQKMPWGDQDALNIVAKGRWQELSRRWNVQTADAEGRGLSWALWGADVAASVERPAIVHYSESEKPWKGKPDHRFAHLWFEALERSSWAGWRPGRPDPITRLGRRLARTANVLMHG